MVVSSHGSGVRWAGSWPWVARPVWQWAGQFELVGVDLMLDSELNVWLMEMNASPSLATEEAAGTPGPERDLPTKRAMLRDMLRPRTQMRPNHPPVFHLIRGDTVFCCTQQQQTLVCGIL